MAKMPMGQNTTITKTIRRYSVTTMANSYVAPWGATGGFNIPTTDTDDNWIPITGVLLYSGAPNAPVSITGNSVVVVSAVAGTYNVDITFIKAI
jgi:hypothetical protein